MTTEPTAEGKRRWPPDGIYGMTDPQPCTCKPECNDPRKGECGCQACDNAYQDWLSSPASLE